MNPKIKTLLFQTILLMLPMVYLYTIWDQLPEQVPVHYNLHNEPDRMGSKTEFIFLTLFLTALSIGISALLLYIHKIDPKQKYAENSALMRKISWVLVVFMDLLMGFMIYQTQSFATEKQFQFSSKIVLVLVSLLFVVLGNFMNNVKPSYFVGIRTPWALESEENWRKTHHLAAKLMFFGGLAITLLVIVLPEPAAGLVLTLGLVPLVLIPFVYSYLLYKREKQ